MNSNTMRLYIAGPMTGYENYNYDAFKDAEQRLTGLVLVESPTNNFAGDQTRSYREYMAAGFQQVLRSDGIVLLPKWEDSPGARREVAIAQWLERPVWLLGLFLRDPERHIEAWRLKSWHSDTMPIRVKCAIAPSHSRFFHAAHEV